MDTKRINELRLAIAVAVPPLRVRDGQFLYDARGGYLGRMETVTLAHAIASIVNAAAELAKEVKGKS